MEGKLNSRASLRKCNLYLMTWSWSAKGRTNTSVVPMCSGNGVVSKQLCAPVEGSVLILVYVVLAIGISICILVRSMLLATAGYKMANLLFTKMHMCIFRASMSFFNSTPSGRILNRIRWTAPSAHLSTSSIRECLAPSSHPMCRNLAFLHGRTTDGYHLCFSYSGPECSSGDIHQFISISNHQDTIADGQRASS